MSYQHETEQDYLDAQHEEFPADDTESQSKILSTENLTNNIKKYKVSSYYASNDFGNPIRNAMTGNYYYNDNEQVIRVGDKEETRFYRVIDATGTNGNTDPNKLYYDCKEEYMDHRG